MKYTLRAIRINKGDSIKQASEGIGVSVDTLANYEKGKTFPDIPILKNIESYYGVTYNDINFYPKITVKQ